VADKLDAEKGRQGEDRVQSISLSPRLLQVMRFIVAHPKEAIRLAIHDEESQQFIQALRRNVADVIGQPLLVHE
jgi:hypothetical protein